MTINNRALIFEIKAKYCYICRTKNKLMTVIACKITKDFIEIASDNQTTFGNLKYESKKRRDQHIEAFGKIIKINEIVLACAGGVREINMLHRFCKTHSPKELEVDELMDWFLEYRDWLIDKTKISLSDISISGFIIKNKKAFAFFDHLEVFEIENFEAIGSGKKFAIGAMAHGSTASEAVEIAMEHDLYCGKGLCNVIINRNEF